MCFISELSADHVHKADIGIQANNIYDIFTPKSGKECWFMGGGEGGEKIKKANTIKILLCQIAQLEQLQSTYGVFKTWGNSCYIFLNCDLLRFPPKI